jgi:hypothetical protein
LNIVFDCVLRVCLLSFCVGLSKWRKVFGGLNVK